MTIKINRYKKTGDILNVQVPLFCEEINNPYNIFCGQPFMYVVVWQKDEELTCTVGIGDKDDFDCTKTFNKPTLEQIHEIINWVYDHKYAKINDYTEILQFLDDINV